MDRLNMFLLKRIRGESVTWPPRPALLTDTQEVNDLFDKPQASWDKNDWKLYSEFLEDRGACLAAAFEKRSKEYWFARKRLSRKGQRKKDVVDGLTLLGGGLVHTPKKKRGRKEKTCKYDWLVRGEEILELKAKYGLEKNVDAVRLYLEINPVYKSEGYLQNCVSKVLKHRKL